MTGPIRGDISFLCGTLISVKTPFSPLRTSWITSESLKCEINVEFKLQWVTRFDTSLNWENYCILNIYDKSTLPFTGLFLCRNISGKPESSDQQKYCRLVSMCKCVNVASDCVAEFMHKNGFECLQCVSKFSLSTPLKPTDTLGQRDFICLLHSAVSGPSRSRMIDRPRSGQAGLNLSIT